MFGLQLVTAPSWQEVLTRNRNLNWEYFCIIMLQGVKRENSFKVLDNGKKQVKQY